MAPARDPRRRRGTTPCVNMPPTTPRCTTTTPTGGCRRSSSGVVGPPTATCAASTTATSRSRWSTPNSTPSRMPTARPSGTSVEDAAMRSRSCSTTAIGRADGSASSRTARRPARAFGTDQPTSVTSRPVPLRADRFSHSRAGFEIRTLRRCRRVLMFHHFAELGGADVGPLHRLHVRHGRGHRDLAARRGDGHRLRPRRRWRVPIGQHAPGRLCLLARSSPISSATSRSPPWATTSRRWP